LKFEIESRCCLCRHRWGAAGSCCSDYCDRPARTHRIAGPRAIPA